MTRFASGKTLKLTAKCNPADTTLYGDIDVGVTTGRLYAVSSLQEEWIDFTGVSASGTSFAYTGLTRGLSQTADPATAGTGKTWKAGSSFVLVAMHDQLPDKQQNNTFSGTQTFTDLNFTGTTTPGLRTKNLTTVQREATTPSNGAIVYDTTEGVLHQYIGGVWGTFASGTTINASAIVAGKVEISTDAEVTSGTATGGTGAVLVITPEQQKKSISLKGAGTTFGDTDEIVVNVSGVDLRVTGANLRESIPASATVKGTVEMATDAEAITGTDETRYINPKQVTNIHTTVNIIASDTLVSSADTERIAGGGTGSFIKRKEIAIGYYAKTLNIRVKFDLKSNNASGNAEGKIYKNGSVVGTPRSTGSLTYVTYSEDFTVAVGDLIQLYIADGSVGQAYCRNFRIYYDEVTLSKIPTINLD